MQINDRRREFRQHDRAEVQTVFASAENTMIQTIEVQNVMCGGCANNITKRLGALDGVTGIEVNVATGAVSFDASEDQLTAIKSSLAAWGYPEKVVSEL
jgi:copper chaperone